MLCRELANQSGAAVLSVDYRLAPEHRFPAAVHDASLAFEWSTENASLLGVDAERIALGGDSAGGNLAIVAALEARDRAVRMPRALALIYPSARSTAAFLARNLCRRLLPRSRVLALVLRALLYPIRAGAKLAGVADARGEPGRLPPAILITAGCDLLTDDCSGFRRANGGRRGPVVRHHRGHGSWLPAPRRTRFCVSVERCRFRPGDCGAFRAKRPGALSVIPRPG